MNSTGYEMARHASILMLLLCSTVAASAQFYNVTSGFLNRNGYALGGRNYTYYFRGAASHIMLPPANDTLSDWQTLPFTFSFFGKDVTGYYISDNGYITFNETASVSVSQTSRLSDATAPSNSIFGFWSDLALLDGFGQWSNEVATSTVGEAPDRVHMIYWMRAVPRGKDFNTSNLSFLIALYERGGFDIGYTVQVGGGLGIEGVYGVVGAKGPDGTESLSVTADSIIAFPPCGFGDADDRGYFFRLPTSVSGDAPRSSSLGIHPTPTSDRATISGTESGLAYTMYDLLGRPVHSGLTPTLDLSGLPTGTYLLRLGVRAVVVVKE